MKVVNHDVACCVVMLVVVVVRILARASRGGTERRLTTYVEYPKLKLAGTANSTYRTGRDDCCCCCSIEPIAPLIATSS